MKIVINKCNGGFGLSHKAVMRYAEITGIKIYPFVEEHDGKLVPYDGVGKYSLIHYSTKPLCDGKYEEGSYWTVRNNRTDPALVQVVEELGDEANSPLSQLKVVEIPDGVQWEIDDYDGMETIHEVHRTWR